MIPKFEYWLPDSNGKKSVRRTTKSNSVIFIGANGAGKSRLGAWIEQQDTAKVHRIGAQRGLNFKENIPLKSYDESEELVMYGNAENDNREKKIYKYGSPREDRYVTYFFDDFNDVLSALLAKTSNQNNDFVEACRNAENEGKEKPHTPEIGRAHV